MRLRIISGELRGRQIKVVPGGQIRPTRDAVREAWFSALGDRLRGSRVLDLFAGSGALGIEALSRGAETVHFVESSRRACSVLRDNLRRLELMSRATVTCGDALVFTERLGDVGSRRFDIVLADPPYGSDAASQLAASFEEFAFADVLCLEHAPAALAGCSPGWQRRYGDTELSFLFAPAKGGSGEQ